ncbi:MAG: DUF6089 family protein [Bacteroidota bacterium]
MRKRIFILSFIFILLGGFVVSAQTFYTGTEWGYSVGGSQYFGDLNDNYGFKTIHPVAGMFTRIHINPYISIKGSVNYTKVSYDDKLNTDNPYELARNLNFESDIIEAVCQSEFNFFSVSTGERTKRFSPFVTMGVGAFYYNPYTTINGKKYYLKDLGTEGQNAGYSSRNYSYVSVCFPIGMGFKCWIAPGVNFSIEVTDRLTLTDYLDDVSTTYVGAEKFANTYNTGTFNPAIIAQDRSVELDPTQPLGRAGKQRGNSSSYDQYMMFLVNFSFQLKTYKCPGYKRRGDDL